MLFGESDDIELQECFDRLVKKQKELQSQLSPIEILINNTREIQTRIVISYTDKKAKRETTIFPKDKWGDKMTDEYRLKTKNECILKTNELLGVVNE